MYNKNLTQPSFVKKSYLYRGTPPRIAIRKAIPRATFITNQILWTCGEVLTSMVLMNRLGILVPVGSLNAASRSKSPSKNLVTGNITNCQNFITTVSAPIEITVLSSDDTTRSRA